MPYCMQREMEGRKGDMLALEREVNVLKVLFVCTCLSVVYTYITIMCYIQN